MENVDLLKEFVDEMTSFCVGKQIESQRNARIDLKGSMRNRNMDSALGEAKAMREVLEKINKTYWELHPRKEN